MKKLTVILLLTAACLTSSAQDIKWYGFQEAVELCKKQPKKIFIDVYTDWCGWCKVYDRNTFSNPAIAEYMNKHYYPVKFNAEGNDTIHFQGHVFTNPGGNLGGNRKPTHPLAVSLLNGKMSYPSVVFMNEKFQLLHVQPGYLSPEQFAPFMVYFGEEIYNTKTTWEEFNKTFKWPTEKK